jgi:DNA-binding NarL/FixJ family response regulator
MHEDDASISRAIGIGADGYVLKTASTDELLQAVRAVAEGGSYLSPAIARRVIDLAGGKRGGSGSRLTERELEILRLLSEGNRPAEVAQKLFVSIKTVKNHLTSIYSKLGVATGAQAVAEAFRLGLVSSPPRSE